MRPSQSPLIDARYAVTERRTFTVDKWQDVWPGPTDRVPLTDTPKELEVHTEGATNTAGGGGARQLQLGLLDPDFMPRTEIVPLSGAVAVPVPNGPYMRLNSARVLTAGSYGWVEGAPIDVREASGGAVWSRLQVDSNRGRTGVSTVPANMQVAVTHMALKLYLTKQGDMLELEFQSRSPGEAWYTFMLERIEQASPNFANLGNPDIRFPPRTDLRVSCLATGTPARVTGTFSANFYPV